MVSSAIFRNDFSNQAKRHKILILTHIYRLSFPAANKRVRAVDLLWNIVLSHDYGLPHPFDSFLGAFCKISKVTLHFVTSVCPSAWNNALLTGRILTKFGILVFSLENLSRKFKLYQNPTRITGTLHILCSITFFFRKSCRFWDNVENYSISRQATDGNTIRRMRLACQITKTRIQTHSQHKYFFFFQGDNN
jgi:hypothetical protein